MKNIVTLSCFLCCLWWKTDAVAQISFSHAGLEGWAANRPNVHQDSATYEKNVAEIRQKLLDQKPQKSSRYQGRYTQINGHQVLSITDSLIMLADTSHFYPNFNNPHAALMGTRDIRFDGGMQIIRTHYYTQTSDSTFSRIGETYKDKPISNHGFPSILSASQSFLFAYLHPNPQTVGIQEVGCGVIIFQGIYYLKQ